MSNVKSTNLDSAPAAGSGGKVFPETARSVDASAVATVKNVPDDLFVLADIHGDYKTLVRLLQAGGLIAKSPDMPDPAHLKWTGGKSVLVQTGDLIDKGSESIEVITAMMSLQDSAAGQGGQVVVAMGNHEVELFSQKKGYEKKEDKEQFKKWLDKKTQQDKPSVDYFTQLARGTDHLGPGGASVGRWLQNNPLVVKVADGVFSHAGYTESLDVATFESKAREGMKAKGFSCDFLADPSSPVEQRYGKDDDKDDDKSPLNEWNKGAKGAKPHETEANELRRFGASWKVFGHAPGKIEFPNGDMRDRCTLDGHFKDDSGRVTVFAADTCNSSAVQEDEGAKDSARILHFHKDKGAANFLDHGTLDVFDDKGKDRSKDYKKLGWPSSST